MDSIEEAFSYKDPSTVSWIKINKRDVEVIQKIESFCLNLNK